MSLLIGEYYHVVLIRQTDDTLTLALDIQLHLAGLLLSNTIDLLEAWVSNIFESDPRLGEEG